MSRRRVLPYVIVAVFLVATVWVASPGRHDDGPAGTAALRRFLASTGRDVRERGDPPAHGTFVLLEDLRDPDQAEAVLDWVQRGGRLVLADPESEILPMLGVVAGREPPPGRTRPGCAVPEVRGVRAVRSGDVTGLAARAPAAVACFGRDGGALLVAVNVERGRAIVIGGDSPLTNAHLRDDDNAILALGLIPEGTVVFGSPLPAGASAPVRGQWASLPLAARVALIELALAAVLFALARARRLGKPVLEDPLVPIPAGELVLASARLYRSARAFGFAGSELRGAMIGRMMRRAGAPPSTSPREAAAVLARAGAGREQDLAGALTAGEPRNDEEFVAAARALEDIRRRVEGSGR